jgi:hypothetical protein
MPKLCSLDLLGEWNSSSGGWGCCLSVNCAGGATATDDRDRSVRSVRDSEDSAPVASSALGRMRWGSDIVAVAEDDYGGGIRRMWTGS